MTKTVIIEETFCCGYKRCPTAKLYDDGSMDLFDDNQKIFFNPDQAEAFLAFLVANKTKER